MARFIKGLTIVAALALTSCSYFQKKKCNGTNWYQFGYDKALSGKRLSGDTFVKKCQEVEADVRFDQMDSGFKEGLAKYCSKEGAYSTGRTGKELVATLCDGEKLLRTLRASFKQGREDMCKNDGYKLGKSGWQYVNQCPPELEKAFLTKYSSGRIRFLRSKISSSETEYDQLQYSINALERERSVLQGQLMSARPRQQIKRTRVYDPKTGRYTEQTQLVDDFEAQNRRNGLQRDYDSKSFEIRKKQDEKKQIRANIRKYRDEISGLEDQRRGY